MTVNPATGILEKAFHFDTHAQDVDLFTSMENIEKPRILLGVVKEDAYRRLSEGSKKYLQVIIYYFQIPAVGIYKQEIIAMLMRSAH